MNIREKFVNNIYHQVSLEGVDMIISILQSPPGRKPKQELKKLSEYFNSKTNEEKEIIKEIIEMSVNSTLFDFFCILDQVNKFDGINTIKLFALNEEKEVLLNDINEQSLHDLFNIEIGNTR